VTFTNRLPQETTIHRHGVRVPNAMDGVPHLTQPPMQPGESFVYEFTPKDAGTFWYHPHVRSSEQVERGLYGVLIVDDPIPPPYTRDVTWVIDDWLLDASGQIVEAFNTPHELAHDGRWGNRITVNGRTDEVLRVGSGERIRLRLLNTANGRVFIPDFGALAPTLIAVDGRLLARPIAFRGYELAPGNRADLDITFAAATSARYVVVDRFSERRTNALAQIDVDGIGPQAAAFDSPANARVPAGSPGPRRRSPVSFGSTRAAADRSASNGPSTSRPLQATIIPRLRRWSSVTASFTGFDSRTSPPGSTLSIHGMFFRLLGREGRAVDEPFLRDTVLIHGRETIDIGVVPLDPGRWMMQCHILEHAEAGMMTTLEVRSATSAAAAMRL